MKNIVFLGNCQGRRLEVLYNETFSSITGDTTEFVGSFEGMTPEVRRSLAEADVIVVQAIDSEHEIGIGKFETKAQVIEFPLVTGVFLWPYSGDSHIRNQPLPDLLDGPYGQQFGDRWLNKKIKAGVKPEDIAAEYEALDVAKAINLDRMYELVMYRAKQRDARTGFDLTSIIERSFTEHPLFLTPANLELQLFRPLAAGVFERLGIPSAIVNAALDTLWRTPFPIADHPIHPSVARHFGLKFIGPDTRYRMLTGDRLTHGEWVRNYVHYRWNDALLEGTHRGNRCRRFDDAAQAALDQLEAGLATANGSAPGEFSRTYLLQLKGDLAGALEATRRAAALDPANPQILGTLAFYTADHEGDLAEAERVLRDITTRWPHYADGWNRLGSILIRRGNRAEAVTALRQAVAIEPRNVGMRKHLASLLVHSGDLERARSILAMGIAMTPDQPDLVGELSRVFVQSGDLDSALIAARRASELDRQNAGRHKHLADILVLRNDLMGAVGALREAVAVDPNDTALSSRLMDLLTQLGRPEEAAKVGRPASSPEPANLLLRHPQAQQLIAKGAFQQAEEAIVQAISADPFDETLHAGLADVLARQGRLSEAAASADRALQLTPESAQLRYSLAPLLARLRRVDGPISSQAAE